MSEVQWGQPGESIMGWIDTLMWPIRRMRPEITAFFVVIVALLIVSWMNRDLSKGFGPSDAGAIAGRGEMAGAAPVAGVVDKSAEAVQQAQAFTYPLYRFDVCHDGAFSIQRGQEMRREAVRGARP